MDIIEIKDEELLTPKQETDCEIITIDEDEIEILDVKEEVENGNGNFEKVFLPEVYGEVLMETPFFEYNSYQKHSEAIEGAKPTVLFTKNDNTNINRHSGNEYKQMIQERYHTICNNDKTQNNGYNDSEFNILYRDVYINTSAQKNRNNNSLEFIRTYENCDVLDGSVQIVGDNKNEFSDYTSKNIIVIDSRIEANKRPREKPYVYKGRSLFLDIDENCKYKCHLCKRERGFYTLEAINNHLKFEHISVFKNSKLTGKKLSVNKKDDVILVSDD